MALDLISVAIAAGFALVGAVGGMGGGLVHLLAVAGGLAAAAFLGESVGAFLARGSQWPAPAGQAVAMALLFFSVALVGHGLLLKLTRRFREGDKSGFSRLTGAVMGFAAGATLAFMALAVVTFMEEPIPGFSDRWRFQTGRSSLADVVRKNNPLVQWRWTTVSSLRRAVRVALDPKMEELVKNNPALQVLAEDPRVKALGEDKALRKAVSTGDDLALLRSKEVLSLLADPDVVMKLSRIVEERGRLDALGPLDPAPAPAKK